jgi:hypothetical protein
MAEAIGTIAEFFLRYSLSGKYRAPELRRRQLS